MKIHVYNQTNRSIQSDLNKVREYFKQYITLEFVEQKTDFDIDYYKYTDLKKRKRVSIQNWAEFAIKEHNIVYYKPSVMGNNRCDEWLGKDVIQVCPVKKANWKVIAHEMMHLFHQDARRHGIKTEDTMDRYDVNDPSVDEGNFPRNLENLKPYFAFIALRETRPFLAQLVRSLRNLVHPKKVVRIEDFASAIQEHEGWYPGSRSYRHNNPGNLRSWPGAKVVENFAFFNSFEEGWNALIGQIKLGITGESQFYYPRMTIQEFFEVYAPSGDNNDPHAYARAVARRLGVSTNYKIGDIQI